MNEKLQKQYIMRKIRISVITVLSAFFLAGQILSAQKVLPSEAQIKWAESEIGVLIHFDMPVFEPSYDFRKDWNSSSYLSIFNPKELDTDQWIRSAKAAGATYVVLVAKHCSGFSLWPTKAHEYSVKNVPWKNGKGDIVGDFIASCKKYGVKPGIYASTTANGYLKVDNPGKVVSSNQEEQKKYNEIVKMQLTELWSQYGDLFEVWFDGGVLPLEKGGFDVLALLKKHQLMQLLFRDLSVMKITSGGLAVKEGAGGSLLVTGRFNHFCIRCYSNKGLNGNPEGLFRFLGGSQIFRFALTHLSRWMGSGTRTRITRCAVSMSCWTNIVKVSGEIPT